MYRGLVSSAASAACGGGGLSTASATCGGGGDVLGIAGAPSAACVPVQGCGVQVGGFEAVLPKLFG